MYLLKFLFGILFVQSATLSLILLAPDSFETTQGILRLILPLAFISFMVVFWFGSLLEHAKKDATQKLRQDFYKETEKIKTKAQKEKDNIKDKVAKEKEEIHIKAQREIAKEARATSAKANFKVGASFAGVLGVGALFVFAQMVTVGLLAMTTAGGALGGYYYRGKRIARKEDEARYKELQHIDAIDVKVIEHKNVNEQNE